MQQKKNVIKLFFIEGVITNSIKPPGNIFNDPSKEIRPGEVAEDL